MEDSNSSYLVLRLEKMSKTGKNLFVMLNIFLLSSAHLQKSRYRPAEVTLGDVWGQKRPVPIGQTASCFFGCRNANGVKAAVCRKPCVNGKCVGPDKCSCSAGYKGPHCDEDVNECGLLKRPCSQRCMNTPGSYRCYCEPGYSLTADGYTCTRDTTCFSLRCQFGCQLERSGTVQCLCPPGLHLATDNKTCKDVDECQKADVCPTRRTCRNTFGSFVCVCSDGFVMGRLRGSVECRDKDECLVGDHTCSRHARCINTEGSYSCRCLEDHYGNGRSCWPRRAPWSKAAMFLTYKLSKRTRPEHTVFF